MARKKRKLGYWEQRNLFQEELVHEGINDTERTILRAYDDAQKYLRKQIKKIYQRYISKTDKSEVEVQRILNTTASVTEIAELRNLAATLEDKEVAKQAKDYLTGLAVKARITRLEDLKAKTDIIAKQVADIQLKQQTDFYVKVVNDAYNQAASEAIIKKAEHDGATFEIVNWQKKTATVKNKKVQISNRSDNTFEIIDWKNGKVIHEVKIKSDQPITKFKELSTKTVKNVLDTHWHGSNFSKRIWGDTEFLAQKIKELFTAEAFSGMSEMEMVKELTKVFDVSKGVARRLIRTEANFVHNQAKLKGWKAHGVEFYKLLVVKDFRTSSICQKKSNENKVYRVDEAVCNGADGNYPPFHPWCRTIAIVYFGERSERGKMKMYDPIGKEYFTLDLGATYKQWEKQIIDKNGKKDVALMRKKVKNYSADLKQYRRYQQAISKKQVPKTFDEFQDLKYNRNKKEWKFLKQLYQEKIGGDK